jgi:hypothetical protein
MVVMSVVRMVPLLGEKKVVLTADEMVGMLVDLTDAL